MLFMILTSAAPQGEFVVADARELLLTIKGVWGGATATILFKDGQLGTYQSIDNGSFSEFTNTEARFVSPSVNVRIILTGSSGTTNLSAQILTVKN